MDTTMIDPITGLQDRSCESTDDGRFRIGQHVVITREWAEELRKYVYLNTRSIDEIRALYTGPIAEIWACDGPDEPWWTIRVKCQGPDPWEIPDDLELVACA